jgi:predicted MFS family arabinose efflux permease
MAAAAEPISVAVVEKPAFSERYTRWALVLLMFIYTSNFIDRTILATLGQAIKIDLKLSDAQLGLLQGIAFALFYTVLGIPVARLAERFNRVNILTICLIVWSGMTALSGTATNFLQLSFYRFGVGVGEAGCAPSAQSLIADYFPPERRSSALSVYAFGIPLGGMIGSISGGWIAEHMSWRMAFFIVGVPGLVLAAIARTLLREPPRGMSEAVGAIQPGGSAPSIMTVARKLFRNRSFIHMTAGATLVSFVGYGVGGFAQPYFIRNFHLGLAQVGIVFGLIGGVSAGLGTLVGGFVTDWASRHDRRWYAWVPGIGFLIALPFYMSAYMVHTWTMAALILAVPGVFAYTYLGPTFATMHNLVEPRMRATGTALLFFILNLIGLGGGPYFTGLVSDVMTQRVFAAHGLGAYAAACPGGRAVGHVAASMAQTCMSASADGVRAAILITYLFGIWGAAHFFLAARELRSDLNRAEAEVAAV